MMGDATRLTFTMKGECTDDPLFVPCLSADHETLTLDRYLSGYFQAVWRRDSIQNSHRYRTLLDAEGGQFATNKFSWNPGPDASNWIPLPTLEKYNYKQGDSISVCSGSGTFPSDQDCSPCDGANMDWDLVFRIVRVSGGLRKSGEIQ
jgi:hypothetical protein